MDSIVKDLSLKARQDMGDALERVAMLAPTPTEAGVIIAMASMGHFTTFLATRLAGGQMTEPEIYETVARIARSAVELAPKIKQAIDENGEQMQAARNKVFRNFGLVAPKA